MFSVNFAKFLRTPFLTEHLRWLPLVSIKDALIFLEWDEDFQRFFCISFGDSVDLNIPFRLTHKGFSIGVAVSKVSFLILVFTKVCKSIFDDICTPVIIKVSTGTLKYSVYIRI